MNQPVIQPSTPATFRAINCREQSTDLAEASISPSSIHLTKATLHLLAPLAFWLNHRLNFLLVPSAKGATFIPKIFFQHKLRKLLKYRPLLPWRENLIGVDKLRNS